MESARIQKNQNLANQDRLCIYGGGKASWTLVQRTAIQDIMRFVFHTKLFDTVFLKKSERSLMISWKKLPSIYI